MNTNQTASISLKQHLPGLTAGDWQPDQVQTLGHLELLRQKKLAFFCSVRCPGANIVQAYDFIQSLCYHDVTMIGGFHSPIEKECLLILLRRQRNAIICPARSLDNMRIISEYKKGLARGRLLFLSAFTGPQKRATAQLSYDRNRLAATLADSILVAYADRASKTLQLCRELHTSGKPIFTFADPANSELVALGAVPIDRHKKNVILNI